MMILPLTKSIYWIINSLRDWKNKNPNHKWARDKHLRFTKVVEICQRCKAMSARPIGQRSPRYLIGAGLYRICPDTCKDTIELLRNSVVN